MLCQKCGNKLENDAKFCNVCGEKVDNNIQTSSEVEPQSINTVTTSNTNIKQITGIEIGAYAIAGLMVFITIATLISFITLDELGVGGSITLPFTMPTLYIIGLILTITSKVKNPKSKHSNILIIIYIVLGILLTIAMIKLIMFLKSCYEGLGECSSIG